MQYTIYRCVHALKISAMISLLLLLSASVTAQAPALSPATIVNDEGGPVVVTGTLTITNPNIKQAVAQPLVLLEDQGGFVTRNQGFLFPLESQVLGQFTSDFFAPGPTTYSLSLPVEPQGTLNDVDNDGEDDLGVQIFAVAYWNNAFGGPFLEKREQAGFGWSGAYASTRVSDNPEEYLEIIGGTYIVYAPDSEQGFPAGFGDDDRLFTPDDPIVGIPAGYTLVTLDTDPFTFDRTREPVIDLIEPESAPFDDFSNLSYTGAFDALVEKARREYAFTEFLGIDWDALSAEFRPRIADAEASGNFADYAVALDDFALAIPDGHVAVFPGSPVLAMRRSGEIGGGYGLTLVELDDGRVLVNHLVDAAPAQTAGIEVGAEIIAIDDTPILEAVAATPLIQSVSSPHVARLQQYRNLMRAGIDTPMKITYRNPDAETEATVTLNAVGEFESFNLASLFADFSATAPPVEYEIRPDGYGYLKLNGFLSNEILTVQLLEYFMGIVDDRNINGVIVDLRTNPGGFPFLSDQMSAYFFEEERIVGNRGRYNDDIDAFFFDPNTRVRLFPPPQERLRFLGNVAVLIGPGCASACERFAYNLSLREGTALIGHYPTAGLGGGVEEIAMPDGVTFNLTVVRAVDENGEIHIEGQGVAPTIDVPLTAETALSDGDPLMDAALDFLRGRSLFSVIPGS